MRTTLPFPSLTQVMTIACFISLFVFTGSISAFADSGKTFSEPMIFALEDQDFIQDPILLSLLSPKEVKSFGKAYLKGFSGKAMMNCTPPVGTPCNDGNICTVNDVIQSDCTCSGIPLDCDDADPCTVNSCDPNVGCVFEDPAPVFPGGVSPPAPGGVVQFGDLVVTCASTFGGGSDQYVMGLTNIQDWSTDAPVGSQWG